MDCEKCASYKFCKEKQIILKNCKWFMAKDTIISQPETDLKKCPFCGRFAVMIRHIENREDDCTVQYQVRCSETHCAAKTGLYRDGITVAFRWNIRSEPILMLEHLNA